MTPAQAAMVQDSFNKLPCETTSTKVRNWSGLRLRIKGLPYQNHLKSQLLVMLAVAALGVLSGTLIVERYWEVEVFVRAFHAALMEPPI